MNFLSDFFHFQAMNWNNGENKKEHADKNRKGQCSELLKLIFVFFYGIKCQTIISHVYKISEHRCIIGGKLCGIYKQSGRQERKYPLSKQS